MGLNNEQRLKVHSVNGIDDCRHYQLKAAIVNRATMAPLPLTDVKELKRARSHNCQEIKVN